MTNNEPAFPVDGGYHEELESIEGVMHVRGSAKPAHTGITKREYFAAKALQALISSHTNPSENVIRLCDLAYEFADEML